MKLLLDTHTFLWLDSEPEKLSATALAACEDPDNELYFSVVSAWEIQIKANSAASPSMCSLKTWLKSSKQIAVYSSCRWSCAMSTPSTPYPECIMTPLIACSLPKQERNERTW